MQERSSSERKIQLKENTASNALSSNLSEQLSGSGITVLPSSDETIIETTSPDFISNLDALRKGYLDDLEQVTTKNSSLISRMANFWGKIPWWGKLFIATAFFAPPIVTGVLIHLTILTIVSIVTAVVFTLVSFLLDNHHKSSANIKTKKENLKNHLIKLFNYFSSTIQELTVLNTKFKEENEKFADENKTLKKTTTSLQATQKDLENNVKTLNDSIAENKNVLTKTQDELTKLKEDYNQAKKDHETCQIELAKQIKELETVKNELQIELDKVTKATTVIDTLQGTVASLSRLTIENEEDHAIFQKKLNNFLTNGGIGLEVFSAKMKELEGIKQQLEITVQQHQTLLNTQAVQIDQLNVQINRLIGTDNNSNQHLATIGEIKQPNKLITSSLPTKTQLLLTKGNGMFPALENTDSSLKNSTKLQAQSVLNLN